MAVSRMTVVGVLIAVPLLLLALLPVVVPYQVDSLKFDRCTGLQSAARETFGIHRSTYKGTTGGFGMGYGDMTGPKVEYLVERWIKQWPWSTPLQEKSEPGYTLKRLYWNLFAVETLQQTQKISLSEAEVKVLMKERLAVWNSSDIEKDPAKLLAYYEAENEKLPKKSPSP